MAKKASKEKPAEQAQVEAVEINSIEEADAALREWGELNAKEKTLTEGARVKVNAILTEAQGKMVVMIGQESVGIPSRRSALEAGIKLFCTNNRAKILEGLETKSRKLTHGVVKWHGQALKLVDTEAVKSTSDAKAFINGLLAAARKALKKLKCVLFGKDTDLLSTDVITVKVEWNNTLIFEKYKAGELKIEQLKAAGFDVVGGPEAEDNFSAQPNEVTIKSEATA